MSTVLILGIAINVIALPIVFRRVGFLYRLITSGQPAPDRVAGVTGRIGRAIKTQLVEVLGQRKLLKWSIPGAAHAFVMWAFIILGTVYVEAYGSLFTFPEGWAIPIVGHWEILGFAQDFIAVMCLLGIITFAAIRVKQSPARLGRRSRFKGSHTGGAWLVLFMIFNVLWTMFLFRGASAATGNLPYDSGAFVSIGIGNLLDGLSHDTLEVLEGAGLILHIGVMLVFLIDVVHSKHLHIFLAPLNVLFKRQPVGARRGQAAHEPGQAGHPRRHRRPRRGRRTRRRHDRGLQLEGHPRLHDLHRVRPLPVAVPGLEHREAALAEAADHGAARPRVRQGAALLAADGERRATLVEGATR